MSLSPSAGWQRIAGGMASAATREDMMTALANLEAVLVKATVDGVARTSSIRSVLVPTLPGKMQSYHNRITAFFRVS